VADVFCPNLKKLEFRKVSTNIEFHNSLSGGTDRRDEANANAPFSVTFMNAGSM